MECSDQIRSTVLFNKLYANHAIVIQSQIVMDYYYYLEFSDNRRTQSIIVILYAIPFCVRLDSPDAD